MMYKIFISGIFILMVAVLLNFIAPHLRINTWYGFLNEISKAGLIVAIKNQGILSIIFLFLIYPFILGAVGYLVFEWLK